MRKLWITLALVSVVGLTAGCQKADQPGKKDKEEEIELKKTYQYVNVFARNTMNLYYLWNTEIKSGIDAWKDTEEPIAKVKGVRYKDDRWTRLYDDFSAFYGSVTGNHKTYGFEFLLYGYDEDHVCAVVTYTYADSPARKAGLQRGDVIVQVNGKPLDRAAAGSTQLSPAAVSIFNNEMRGGDKVELGYLKYDAEKEVYTQQKLALDAMQMYEDPILLSKVFDCGGKKVGYLVFTSFTLDACEDLVRVAKEFKAEGVSELILDLRYNGGGFVFTERVLAALLAPEAEVLAGSVLSTEVFNDNLSEFYKSKNEDTNTYLETVVVDKDSNGELIRSCTTEGANIGITKLYAIITSGSASASEAILCDLFPYLDITLVGQQSHGKFCSGVMMEGPAFYEDYKDQLAADTVEKGKKYTENWGLYLMLSRFADKNGVTRCMPDGLAPDIKVKDNPQDGYQLGSPQETMLAVALGLAGYEAKAPAARKADTGQLPLERIEGIGSFRPEFGMRILHRK